MSFSILIVDDEPDIAEMFRQRFRRESRQGTYGLHCAGSGEGAPHKLADGVRPELIVILSDINMPGMDGLSLLREIKTRRPDLPVMMVTAYGDEDRRRQAEEAGALQFLSKPVDFDLLKEELRRLPRASAWAGEGNAPSRTPSYRAERRGSGFRADPSCLAGGRRRGDSTEPRRNASGCAHSHLEQSGSDQQPGARRQASDRSGGAGSGRQE